MVNGEAMLSSWLQEEIGNTISPPRRSSPLSPIAQRRAGPQGLVLGSTSLESRAVLTSDFVCKHVESPHYLGQPALLRLKSKEQVYITEQREEVDHIPTPT